MPVRTLSLIALVLALPLAATASVRSLGEPEVVAKIRTGFKPCSETGGLGFLWVANYGEGTLSRIDPATNEVTGTVRLGLTSQPCGIGIGAGALWVTGYGTAEVIRVDPVRLRVVKRIPAGSGVWDVIYAAGSGVGNRSRAGSRLACQPADEQDRSADQDGRGARQPPVRLRRRLGRVAGRHDDVPHQPTVEQVRHDSCAAGDAGLSRRRVERRLGRKSRQ